MSDMLPVFSPVARRSESCEGCDYGTLIKAKKQLVCFLHNQDVTLIKDKACQDFTQNLPLFEIEDNERELNNQSHE